MGKIFGTDGVRGIAGSELSIELAISIGKAITQVIDQKTDKKPLFLVGKDTRISSDMLENALCTAICSAGGDVLKLGVVPTPAVAYLIKELKADAGAMISASHNSYEYNGIKLFSSNGYKLSDEQEKEIEDIIQGQKPYKQPKTFMEVGKVLEDNTLNSKYCDYILDSVNLKEIHKLKVAIDCSNGSASATAERVFSNFGLDLTLLNNTPDGNNINKNCGSTHMDILSDYVVQNKCDLGFAFDGDADRFLAVDEMGEIIDGDVIMAILADYLKSKNKLKNNTVVATVMSNLGFMKFAKEKGINVPATKVGDRYVLEEMVKNEHNLGGEQSGHIIMLDYMSTGDGQLTALMMLKIISETKKSLSGLKAVMKVYPQVLVNVKVNNHVRDHYSDSQRVNAKIEHYNKELSDRGRILVRASGTEPLVRVMVEGENEDEIKRIADDIALEIKELV